MTASIQTKRNKYYIVLNWVEAGKRRQKWISTNLSVTGNNKRRAEKLRIETLRAWESKITLENYENILFSDYLIKWLEETKHNIAETTYRTYKNLICSIISPYFAEKRIQLSDLKAHDIQEFYGYKMRHDNVSANTICHYHANIRRALEYAVKTERIKDNPAARVDLPRKQKHVADFYTAEELKILLRAARGSDIEPVVLIAAWFGLRRGEILGLRWSAIDFENCTITVRGALAWTTKLIYKETTKTQSSLRTLPMTKEAVNYFRDLQKRQQQNMRKLGKHYLDEWKDFVCVHKNGAIMRPDYVSRHFPKLCEQCGLRKLHLHELRHSNISLLLSAGASMKEAQLWAGHSSYSTTADIYAHIEAKNKMRLSESIHALLAE